MLSEQLRDATPPFAYSEMDPRQIEVCAACRFRPYHFGSVRYLAFFFNTSQLRQVAISLPSWAHADAYRKLVAEYGAPYASQLLPAAGVRLHGWRLPDGGALFYNGDRPLNPLDTNAIYWRSATECRAIGCFKSER